MKSFKDSINQMWDKNSITLAIKKHTKWYD